MSVEQALEALEKARTLAKASLTSDMARRRVDGLLTTCRDVLRTGDLKMPRSPTHYVPQKSYPEPVDLETDVTTGEERAEAFKELRRNMKEGK